MKNIFALVLILLASCATPKIGDVSDVPGPPGTSRPAPSKGWPLEYTEFIQANVTDTMLNFPAPSFCPKWKALDEKGRRDFWAAVLESTSYAETGFNRLDMYREDGQSISNVTGKRNTSEGLLQLSYGDAGCETTFDYAKDKAAFLDDYARFPSTLNKAEISSRHPERTILDPYLNLQCGINIWTRLIKKYGNSPKLTAIGLRYWSTLNPARRAYGEDTIPNFKKRMPSCF